MPGVRGGRSGVDVQHLGQAHRQRVAATPARVATVESRPLRVGALFGQPAVDRRRPAVAAPTSPSETSASLPRMLVLEVPLDGAALPTSCARVQA
jgi:hypothetical protein